MTSSTTAVSVFTVFAYLNFIFHRVTSSTKAIVVFISFAYVDFIFHPKAIWSTRRAWCSAFPTRSDQQIYRLCLCGFFHPFRVIWSTSKGLCTMGSGSPTRCNLRIYRRCLSGFSSWLQVDLDFEKGVVQHLTNKMQPADLSSLLICFFFQGPRISRLCLSGFSS